jgi:multiple sugar transport system substrate-binding protein
MTFILILTGCSSGSNQTSGPTKKNNNDAKKTENKVIKPVYDSSLSGNVTFWTFTPDVYKGVVEAFNKDYPNIKVNLVGMDTMHDKLQTTLAAGQGAPDVAQVENGQFSRYVTGGLLEDLLQPPYDAGRYKNDLSTYSWERYKSVDGKKLLGMPWDVTPGVWLYRQDLYEQVGLPSDPNELGEYLKDPQNVLTAAQTLAANGMYMFEWRDSPAIQYGDAIGFYDSDYKWLRNDEKMAQLLDFVKRGNQLKWAPQLSVIFSDEGKQLVKQGKIASFPIGSWGPRALESIFPEQAGKWRITTMPLGLNVGLGGSTFVIPSQSQNKQAAWAFVEWMINSENAWKLFAEASVQPAYKHITSLPWYIEHKNDYFGGQEDYKVFEEIADQIPVRRLTPVDAKSWDIYIKNVTEAIDKNIDSKTTLQQIEDTIEKQLGPDIEKLKTGLNQ